jgi:hypothetical protein
VPAAAQIDGVQEDPAAQYLHVTILTARAGSEQRTGCYCRSSGPGSAWLQAAYFIIAVRAATWPPDPMGGLSTSGHRVSGAVFRKPS